jgi:methionyl-tRNA formyltransferase
LNIHASLLPRWRGAAPIHRALEAGDTVTGVTIMQMDAGLDTGDMLLSHAVPIELTDTTSVLHDKLADLGGHLIVQALAGVGQLKPQVQPSEGVTYAHKIEKSESGVDWQQPAEVIERRMRAFDPFPGVSCVMASATATAAETVKLWQAQVVANTSPSPAGTLVSADARGVCVACGEDALRITQLQRPGGKRQSAADFLRGFPMQHGQRLGATL